MSLDGAIREAAREAFEEIDDATFWTVTKTGAAGAYGRSSTLGASLDEEDGRRCHLSLLSNAPAPILAKLGDKEAYRLHYSADETGDPILEMGESGGYVAVRSDGEDPIAYGVLQAPARTPNDVGIRSPRRWAVLVRLEKQPTFTVL